MHQYIAITVPSLDELYRLRLIDLDGLDLPDHPTADPTDDGRLETGGLATDDAIATLCARGCTRDRGCDIRVVMTKQQLLDQWKSL